MFGGRAEEVRAIGERYHGDPGDGGLVTLAIHSHGLPNPTSNHRRRRSVARAAQDVRTGDTSGTHICYLRLDAEVLCDGEYAISSNRFRDSLPSEVRLQAFQLVRTVPSSDARVDCVADFPMPRGAKIKRVFRNSGRAGRAARIDQPAGSRADRLGMAGAVPLAVMGRTEKPVVGTLRAAAAGGRDAVIDLQQLP